MIKILIFVAGRDIKHLKAALNKFVELYSHVKIDIIGSSGVYPLINDAKFPFIPINEIAKIDFDLILVTGGSDDINGPAPDVHFKDILAQLKLFGISENKIILDRVLCIPNFTFEKYELLKKSKPTIFAMHCFGGVIYHRFGLPFYSPIINMFLSEEDMLKFLRAPMKYINSELEFHKWHNDAKTGGGRISRISSRRKCNFAYESLWKIGRRFRQK